MQEIVIDIDPEGVVKGMHRDEFNLGFLGKQKIVRASEIKFSTDSQKWEIFIPLPVGGDELLVKECGQFDSYNVARNFEVLWMNECRLAGVEPYSEAGRAVAFGLRDQWDAGIFQKLSG